MFFLLNKCLALFKSLRNRFLSPVLAANDEIKVLLKALPQQVSSEFLKLTEGSNDEIKVLLKALPQQVSSECLKATEGSDGSHILYMDAITTNRILAKRISQGQAINYENVLESHYTKLIRPGDSVIDVGAHIGRHLAVFIKLVEAKGSVLAFEPLEEQYRELCRIFNAPNVEILNLALSDSPGIMDFYHNETYPEESGLKKRIYNYDDGTIATKQISVTTIDNLSDKIDKLDYIKLDAEGAEISILNGAVNTINKHRPFISVEYGYPGYSVYGLNKNSLYDFCEKNNYYITDIYGNIIPNARMWSELCDTIYWDYFLVPQEKLEFFFVCLHN